MKRYTSLDIRTRSRPRSKPLRSRAMALYLEETGNPSGVTTIERNAPHATSLKHRVPLHSCAALYEAYSSLILCRLFSWIHE